MADTKAVQIEMAPQNNVMRRKFERVQWVLYYLQHTAGQEQAIEFGCCFGCLAFADLRLAHTCCPDCAKCGPEDAACSLCWQCDDEPKSGSCVACIGYACCCAAAPAACIALSMSCLANHVCSCCKDCSVCFPLVCDIGTVDPPFDPKTIAQRDVQSN